MIDNSKLNSEILGNYFVRNNLIPLGYNTWRGNKETKNKIVCLPYSKIGSTVLIATSGWGKSVLLKRIVDYDLGLFSKNKPGLIIDTQGVDFALLQYPNVKYKPLLTDYGERPQALKNVVNYCPIFAKNLKIRN